jgi:hypothetical protein
MDCTPLSNRERDVVRALLYSPLPPAVPGRMGEGQWVRALFSPLPPGEGQGVRAFLFSWKELPKAYHKLLIFSTRVENFIAHESLRCIVPDRTQRR